MQKLRCVVERITYQNPENGYSVLRVTAQGEDSPVTIVGNLLNVNVGAVLLAEGEWKTDARYGRQFQITGWEETMPATAYGIEKYLGSGLIQGIGPRFAGRIVERFGEDTLDIIDMAPQRLLEIEGIGKKRVAMIRESWERQREIRNVMLFLQDHGVSSAYAAKIFKKYGAESVAKVKENPYRLADDIWGIGFKTADSIAMSLGVRETDYFRCRSGILYALSSLGDEGHVYARQDQLTEKAAELLGVEESYVTEALRQMQESEDLIREGEAIYLPAFFYAEKGTAERLLALRDAPAKKRLPEKVDTAAIERKVGMTYAGAQLAALETAAKAKVMVLTGGPGTGKTTVTRGIIEEYRAAGLKLLLAAPTGRAAKRMSEATGLEAKTIHRLLEYQPPGGYQRNENAPLEGDALILDECSMIDLMLMHALLKAIPAHMRVILVGDIDQLPSVGAGNVLRDIIDSEQFPVVRLTEIFRQAAMSRIITNAHRTNQGQYPDLSNGKNTDFFFIEKEEPEDAVKEITALVSSRLPRHYRVPSGDIQVLTPMQRGVTGAVSLNQALQAALNPGEDGIRRGGTLYRVRDRVMQIRNNYEKDVFNGDIGTIAAIDSDARTLTAEFDGRQVGYEFSELDELVLAYATTIHKAQGSEYPIVVLPLQMTHYVMLQRNLLYTGITRAKRVFVLVGTKKALGFALRNVTVTQRNSLLKQRLRGEIIVSQPGQQIIPETGEIIPEKRESTAGRVERVLSRLANSRFRSGFTLKDEDLDYIDTQGINTIERHARDFIRQRLAPAVIPNDGKQTPMKGHPVFIAQHATACCCRQCMEKWHHIPAGRALTEEEQDYILDVLMEWIGRYIPVLNPDAGEEE